MQNYVLQDWILEEKYQQSNQVNCRYFAYTFCGLNQFIYQRTCHSQILNSGKFLKLSKIQALLRKIYTEYIWNIWLIWY